MKTFGWFLFGALALTGTGALAIDTEEGFRDLDANKDGYISVNETKDEATLSRYWYKFDENKDGALDTSEFSAFEDADVDDLEPYVLRHDWYGSIGNLDLAM
jgi:hypothetical protein